MSSLHYFANRYRNRVSRKREFFNLYKTVFVILNMQKSHKISLFKILQLFYHVASQTSSIFTCNTCTKSRGLFSGYFSAAYAFRTLILLTFGRSFQRVPWQMNSIFIISQKLLVFAVFPWFFATFRHFYGRGNPTITWYNPAYFSLFLPSFVVNLS